MRVQINERRICGQISVRPSESLSYFRCLRPSRHTLFVRNLARKLNPAVASLS